MPADKMYLSLALHNHQPVGNFGWVFQEAFEKSYLPMVECLERHPGIRLALHFTGPLRDWLLVHQPEYLGRVRVLADRGQIEIMSGAYYEPILVSLYDADKLGQVLKQNDSVREDFGYDPIGLWLAERVWEPHLPRVLNQAGIRYTIVDDTHFKAAGYTDDDLFGYYVSEEQGHTLAIFATSQHLRYTIPWASVEDVIGWLREQQHAESGSLYAGKPKIAVMGDDGEKFGLWPGTYEHVWERGWMDRFFSALEQSSEWLETIPPADALRRFPSLGRIYLPTSSYDEMGEWAMPPKGAWELPHLKHALQHEGRKDIFRYMRGGFWRNFMVKYAEVNQLHKKALWVSRKVHAMPDGAPKRQALDHLWAGQCNCGYWHGVFGGIYLFHIREADYRNLIEAENLADGVDTSGSAPFVQVNVEDFDLDAAEDVVVTSNRQSLVFDLDRGGALVEWDYRPAGYNLINVLTRREEGYHRDLREAAEAGAIVTPDMEAGGERPESIHSEVVRAREPGLHLKLLYDWHRRAMLQDHFLGAGTTLDQYYRSQYPEQGDFVNQPYAAAIEEKGKAATVTLHRDGFVWQDTQHIPVTVQKRIQLSAGDDRLHVTYRLSNRGSINLETRFGVETNWGFAGGNELQHAVLTCAGRQFSLGETAEASVVADLRITSPLWHIETAVETSEPAALWRFPLEAVSASEAGFERTYQGTSMLHWWEIKVAPGASWDVELVLALRLLD